MEQNELQEIKTHWLKKYPHVSVLLYPKLGQGKYSGKIMTHKDDFLLLADTIGELITQGETFLRKVNCPN